MGLEENVWRAVRGDPLLAPAEGAAVAVMNLRARVDVAEREAEHRSLMLAAAADGAAELERKLADREATVRDLVLVRRDLEEEVRRHVMMLHSAHDERDEAQRQRDHFNGELSRMREIASRLVARSSLPPVLVVAKEDLEAAKREQFDAMRDRLVKAYRLQPKEPAASWWRRLFARVLGPEATP